MASERACGGVLFFAFGDWAEIVSARRVLWLKAFGVVESSVFPFDLRAKGDVSEQGKVEFSSDIAKVAATSKPFANTELVTAKAFQKRFESFDILS